MSSESPVKFKKPKENSIVPQRNDPKGSLKESESPGTSANLKEKSESKKNEKHHSVFITDSHLTIQTGDDETREKIILDKLNESI